MLQDHGLLFNSDLVQSFELTALLECADCLVTGALARQESRGAHSRPHDFPTRDDENFMVHTMAYLTGDPETSAGGHIKLGTKPVVVTNYPPTERKY